MMLWQIAFRFLHSSSPFLFSNVSSKSFPWCTSSPMSELVYGNRQWKGLSCKKNYLRNIWRESVMRQVSLKLSSLSFGISRCCCRKGWLPLPAQDACSLCVLSFCIWRGFGWVHFHLDQTHVPACPQVRKHFCWEETMVRTGRLVWKERWNWLPCLTAAGSYARQGHCETVTSAGTVGELETGSKRIGKEQEWAITFLSVSQNH